MKEKVGIIDVGGGLRDVYGAGIFDYLMDQKIDIPYCIGVSAGSANVASYVSGQRGRNLVFYTEYTFEKEYMSMRNLRKKGSYINWIIYMVHFQMKVENILGIMIVQ